MKKLARQINAASNTDRINITIEGEEFQKYFEEQKKK